jgi:translation initiation factor SUI1
VSQNQSTVNCLTDDLQSPCLVEDQSKLVTIQSVTVKSVTLQPVTIQSVAPTVILERSCLTEDPQPHCLTKDPQIQLQPQLHLQHSISKSKSEIVSLNGDTLVLGDAPKKEQIHIRKIQRTTRNSMTTVDGLSMDADGKTALNFDQMLRKMKKQFHCSGSYASGTANTNEKTGTGTGVRMTLTGDQRQNVMEFLIKAKICKKEDIILHGC